MGALLAEKKLRFPLSSDRNIVLPELSLVIPIILGSLERSFLKIPSLLLLFSPMMSRILVE